MIVRESQAVPFAPKVQNFVAASVRDMGLKLQLKIAIQLLTAVMLYATVIWITAGVVALADGRHVSDPLIVFGCVHLMALLSLIVLVVALVRYPYALIAYLVTNSFFIIGTSVLLGLMWSKTLGYMPYKRLIDWPLVQVFLIWELVVAIALEVLVEFKIRTLTGWSVLKRHSNSSATILAIKPEAGAKDSHRSPETMTQKSAGLKTATDQDRAIREQVMHGLNDHEMMEVRSDPLHA